MKKRLAALLLCLVLAGCMTIARAEDVSRCYAFALTANGTDICSAQPGDIITVTFTLQRTDGEGESPMYAMQNEIAYDGSFFQLVEGNALLSRDIRTAQTEGPDGRERFYMNYLSTSGGEMWPAQRIVGSFQLCVVGTAGSSSITNENYLVSTADGTDTYRAQAQDVTVVVSEETVLPAGEAETGGIAAGWLAALLALGAAVWYILKKWRRKAT